MNNKERLKEIIKILNESNILHDYTPKNVKETIEKLGSTFIKIGQILSTRVDILPMEYCDELSKLRSEVTPMSYEKVKEILRDSYLNVSDIFQYIDEEPIGSASIAQVHKAKLKNGLNVVIKIKRPNIDEQLKTDINLMKEAIKVLHLNHFITVIDLESALDEIYNVTEEELNFGKEIEHNLTFLNNNKDNKIITAPHIFTEYCTKNTIVMEEIQGIKINDIEKLKERYNTTQIAKLISDNYIKQAIDDGMFHADPHSDNIMAQGNQIVFIDWGMVGNLKPQNRKLLKKCMKSIILEDYHDVANILVSMSRQTNEVSMDKLTNDIKTILKKVGNEELDEIDTREFIKDMFKMLQTNNLILDYDVTMLIRGIGILEGVLEKLDSNINLVQVLSKHVLEYTSEEVLSKDFIKNASKKVYQNSKSLINLPSEAEELLRSVKDGDFKFKFEMSDSSKHIDKIESLVHELIMGFIDGCLIVAVSNINDLIIKHIFIVLIILITIWIIITMIKDKTHHGY